MKTRSESLKRKFSLVKTRGMKSTICITLLLLAFLISGNIYAQECSKSKKTATKEKPSVSSVLMKCIDKGDLEKITKITSENEGLIDARLKKEETLLTLASYHGHYDIAEYLVNKGANVHLRNDWNNNALINAAMQGHIKIAKLLLKNDAKINARGNSGRTALHYAVRNKQPEVVKLLVENECFLDPQDDYNNTPLLYASWNGNSEIIKTLAEKGADVHYAPHSNNTVLHNLANEGNAEAIKAVIMAGGDANKTNDDGFLPIHSAARSCNPQAVKVLITKTKNFNQKENHYGNTALHIAAKNGDLKSYAILTEAGADQNVLNNKNQKATDLAVQYGQTSLVSYSASKKIIPEQTIKLAKENHKAWAEKTDMGDAKVHYCGHSGWAVNTKNSVLIFDYWSRNKITQDPGFVNGTINPKEIKDKDVYVFVSHDHGDHYDTTIYAWQKDIKDITYIYGFVPEKAWQHKKTGYHGPDYVYIEDNKTKKVGDVAISTLKSNDTGQGFLVEVDGVSIYHPGDHALFTKEDEEGFKKEVDFIAGVNSTVDIAFLPVTGCPSRWKKEFIVEGFFYSIDQLNPKEVFPMHAFNREYSLNEFAEMAKKRNTKADIVCVENNGDNFSLEVDLTARK